MNYEEKRYTLQALVEAYSDLTAKIEATEKLQYVESWTDINADNNADIANTGITIEELQERIQIEKQIAQMKRALSLIGENIRQVEDI